MNFNLIEVREAKSPTFYKPYSAYSTICDDDVEFVKEYAHRKKKSVRICIHKDGDSDLHNMLIAHVRGNYIRPHKNPYKSKAYQIVDGDIRIIGINDHEEKIFDINLKKDKILRIEKDIYLLLLPISEIVVFHEIALGPFVTNGNIGSQLYLDASPLECDDFGIREFIFKYTDGTYKWI